MINTDLPRKTVFSEDRVYRYTLWREWDQLFNPVFCLFICLNPSTATETLDDPTIRRCTGYAKLWGYGAMCVANIFAYRATDPNDMKAAPEPIGERNNYWIIRLSDAADLVIAAWGVHGAFNHRGVTVRALLKKPIHHLGLTKDGHPKHPLYLKADQKPILWI